MMSFQISAALFAVLCGVFGLRALSGARRERFVRTLLFTFAVFIALHGSAGILGLAIPTAAVAAFFILVQLVILIVFLRADPDARWSATGASLFTFFAFALFIPFQAQVSLDGDEPYYLLISESIVEDLDLDLRNQYANLRTSPVGRTDLHPQPDDPVGAEGQQYSRHEPMLALLLAPGLVLGGVNGALLTMAIFAALLARSFVRLLEEEGIGQRAVITTFAIVLFTPPVMNYGSRIWPEVPAAWLFIEAIRGLRQRRMNRLVLALAGLVLIKLRFVAVAVVLVAFAIARSRRPVRVALGALLVLIVPFGLLWIVKGNPLGVHGAWELMPREPWRYGRGLFGLLLDGSAGIAFQAPAMLLGVFALSRWRDVPRAARIAVIAAIPYIALLAVRDEWHGGWSPALRYVVFLVPFLGLAAANAIDGKRFGTMPLLLTAGSAFLSLHALAYPWRLFRIANGENFAGEWLSAVHRSDFSRLFPSFIRPNEAAVVAVVVFLLAFVTSRWWLERAVTSASPVVAALLALAIVMFFAQARRPGEVAHFEDAHVERNGGSLDPPEFTIARFRFDGGWRLAAGQSLSLRYAGGSSKLRYRARHEAEIDIAGRSYVLPPTPHGWSVAEVVAPADHLSLQVIRGEAVFDRIEAQR